MSELIVALLVVSFLLMLCAAGAAFAWVNDEANTKAEWRAMRHWIWKAALGGFFWPIGIAYGARLLWKDYWSKLPDR